MQPARTGVADPKPSRRGFTLVELLVVIGIIAVLIGILVPVLSKARAQANRVACLSNIRQLGIGIRMYCEDNKGWFPTCAYWDYAPAYKPYPDDWLHWQANRSLSDSAIAKYVGRTEQLKNLLRCPADNFDGRKPRAGIAPGQGPYLFSYNMNDGLAANLRPPFSARSRIGQWRAPSRKIVLTETFDEWNTAPAWDYAQELSWRHGIGISRGSNVFASLGKKMGVNVSAVFIDGHAEGVSDDFACSLFQVRAQAK